MKEYFRDKANILTRKIVIWCLTGMMTLKDVSPPSPDFL